ncbi:MAG TPA: GNAT family N-acetyltransferase [Casimicrobiaceae bacterium]|nr:GNAT family N-acetyltransferase [Casimicrobiaceae bacterium]
MDTLDPERPDDAEVEPLAVRDDVPIEAIDAQAWNAIAGGTPLVSHEFLAALHATYCAAPATGWSARYLTAWRGATLAGAVPLYAKAHSYGEYVFDWAWADAYRRYGQRYYPKLVAAIPFTPAPGPRLLAADAPTQRALLEAALALLAPSRSSGRPAYSSLHVLFPTESEIAVCAAAGMLVRHGVQFRWRNEGYRDFADFLSTFNHDKRKKVNQERRKVAASGVEFTRKVGAEITRADWTHFYRCYENTYREHGSTPYLSLEFFERIAAALAGNVLMVVGHRDGRRVCAALDIFDAQALWGRYWGTTEPIRGLHFEACYYQAIEFCIERRIGRFEGGAQGSHKLARGLAPVATRSAHAIADPEFARAIAAFCARERTDVAHAVDELDAASPFKEGGKAPR